MGVRASGLVPGSMVTSISVSWRGNQAVELTFDDAGRLGRKLLFRNERWSLKTDGHLSRLMLEAYQVRLAWLFAAYVATTTPLLTRCRNRSALGGHPVRQ